MQRSVPHTGGASQMLGDDEDDFQFGGCSSPLLGPREGLGLECAGH